MPRTTADELSRANFIEHVCSPDVADEAKVVAIGALRRIAAIPKGMRAAARGGDGGALSDADADADGAGTSLVAWLPDCYSHDDLSTPWDYAVLTVRVIHRLILSHKY